MDIFAGLQQALTPAALLANCSGVALGIIFGSLPGLTAAMGVALLIPLSFGMPTVEAFSLLLGMYCGAIYGGCISATVPRPYWKAPNSRQKGSRSRPWTWRPGPPFWGAPSAASPW